MFGLRGLRCTIGIMSLRLCRAFLALVMVLFISLLCCHKRVLPRLEKVNCWDWVSGCQHWPCGA